MGTHQICVDTDVVIDYLRGKEKYQNILGSLIDKYVNKRSRKERGVAVPLCGY